MRRHGAQMDKNEKADISGRFAVLIDSVGGRSSAARIMELTEKTVTEWKRSPEKMKLEPIMALAAAAGTDVHFLLGAPSKKDFRSPFQQQFEHQKAKLPHNERTEDFSDLVTIPLYDVQLSAGTGSIESRVDVVDQLSFSLSFLQGVGIGSTENAGLFRVTGDSMEPSAPDHSLVIVNTMEQDIVDGIYAIGVDGQARIKRLRKRVTGELEIISDNELYGTETLNGEDLNLVTIIGRVRCIIKWL